MYELRTPREVAKVLPSIRRCVESPPPPPAPAPKKNYVRVSK